MRACTVRPGGWHPQLNRMTVSDLGVVDARQSGRRPRAAGSFSLGETVTGILPTTKLEGAARPRTMVPACALKMGAGSVESPRSVGRLAARDKTGGEPRQAAKISGGTRESGADRAFRARGLARQASAR